MSFHNFKRSGRPAHVLLDILKNIFEKKLDAIIISGKVIVPSDKIWTEICNEIEKKKTPKAIYNDALRWWTAKRLEAGQSKQSDVQVESESDEGERDELEIESELSSEYNDDPPSPNDINFTISLSYEVWKTIEPMPTEHRREDDSHKTKTRIYYELQPGLWTNILVERIADHRIKNPCTWSFKRAKVHPEGEKYILVSAKCTTCHAVLYGEVLKRPEKGENEVKFKFRVRDFLPEKHLNERKNVRIGGSKANELFLSDKKASVLKREMVKESNVQMFEPERGRVINESAIRAGQSRRRQRNKLSLDPVKSIEFLMESNAFGSMIHFLVNKPFSVIYGSPNQFLLYGAYKKKNKYTKITCDATGSVVHKIGKFLISLLYAIV